MEKGSSESSRNFCEEFLTSNLLKKVKSPSLLGLLLFDSIFVKIKLRQ
ncbi:hypothetical protein SAMN05421827_113111 [Pedobacter terrae]|uniref:Uncharacterized protein n=1 Tax=Pedobacter terrae TaxID=405671 RepID=A0A1G7YGU3_9SPHI|nr:hypothetical protein SAMN05421827_113111 [Pedobacter terrae]